MVRGEARLIQIAKGESEVAVDFRERPLAVMYRSNRVALIVPCAKLRIDPVGDARNPAPDDEGDEIV